MKLHLKFQSFLRVNMLLLVLVHKTDVTVSNINTLFITHHIILKFISAILFLMYLHLQCRVSRLTSVILGFE